MTDPIDDPETDVGLGNPDPPLGPGPNDEGLGNERPDLPPGDKAPEKEHEVIDDGSYFEEGARAN